MKSKVFSLLILITLFSCKQRPEEHITEVNSSDTMTVESTNETPQSKADTSSVEAQNANQPASLQYESYCNDRWMLCMQLPKDLFIHKGNTCSTVVCDEFVSKNSLVSFTIHEDIGECENYKDKEYSMEEILNLYKSVDLGEQAEVDSSNIKEESLYFAGIKDKEYKVRMMLVKNNSCINFTMKFPADSIQIYKPIADNIFSSIK